MPVTNTEITQKKIGKAKFVSNFKDQKPCFDFPFQFLGSLMSELPANQLESCHMF
jgi:hypothetical protein